jgi:hypothetical protein
VAGLSAYFNGGSLRLFQPIPREVKELPGNAYALQEKFRSEIASGIRGWGVSGKPDLGLIRKMASAQRASPST